MAFYGHFILDTGRSPGFGPTVSEYRGYCPRALFRLGFPSAPRLKRLTIPDTVARRTVLQKVHGYSGCALHISRATIFSFLLPYVSSVDCFSYRKTCRTHILLPQFVGTGFQVLFHSPPGVLFTFPSRYSTLSVTR